MKKKIVLSSFLVLAALLLNFTSCRDTNTHISLEFKFDFIFKYGVTAHNILDTHRGTFTKDMITAPGITTELTLTADEMDDIYQKMVEIDFFSYPDEFKVPITGNVIGTRTPYDIYYFEVTYGSETKELLWHDEITNYNEKAEALRGLINLIIGIIESKEAYQSLPEPSGGYL